jgi:hypothetical protein
MEIEYVLRPDDALALHKYCMERLPGPGAPQWPLALAGVLLAGVAWFYYLPTGDILTPLVFSAIFLGVGFIVLFQPKRIRAQVLRQMRRQLQDEPKLVGWRRLSISAESITFTGELMTVTARWQMVEQIVVTEDHAFFFTTKRTGLVLPIRAFADEEEFRDFVKAARRYRRAADEDPKSDSPGRRRSRVEETGFTAEEPTDD